MMPRMSAKYRQLSFSHCLQIRYNLFLVYDKLLAVLLQLSNQNVPSVKCMHGVFINFSEILDFTSKP